MEEVGAGLSLVMSIACLFIVSRRGLIEFVYDEHMCDGVLIDNEYRGFKIQSARYGPQQSSTDA